MEPYKWFWNLNNSSKKQIQFISPKGKRSELKLEVLFKKLFEIQVKVKVAWSCPTLRTHGLYSPWNSPGQNTGVGSLSLLLGIFATQGSNPGLPHCSQNLYQLSHSLKLKPTPKVNWESHHSLEKNNKTLNLYCLFIMFRVQLKITQHMVRP